MTSNARQIKDSLARDYFESAERQEEARNFGGAADFYEAACLRLLMTGFSPKDSLIRKITKDIRACRRLS